MIEIAGDMWEIEADARCFTTNGTVKNNGECVMGRGNALQAKQRYPKLSKQLGDRIKELGNHVFWFPEYALYSFPVKHNWWEIADPILIEQSYGELLSGLESDHQKILLPRPGCQNGKLDWEIDVKPILERLGNGRGRIVIVSL